MCVLVLTSLFFLIVEKKSVLINFNNSQPSVLKKIIQEGRGGCVFVALCFFFFCSFFVLVHKD